MSLELVLSAIAIAVASVSIALRYWESPPELKTKIAELELHLMDHAETVTRWMKRENVRRARDIKETQEESPSGPVDISTRKAQIRERLRARNRAP